MKKIAAVVCMTIVASLLLSSCSYRLRLEKVEEPTTAGQETTAFSSGENSSSREETTEEPTTESVTYTQGVYTAIDLSKEDVLALYRGAMNDVKNNCAGFHRSENQQTSDVVAGSGKTQLANSILALVGQSVLNGSEGDRSITVSKGDASAVREYFPLYGRNTGCALTDASAIRSAVCYTDGKSYKLVIVPEDSLNPDAESNFSAIMHPADVEELKNGIAEYLVVLDYSQFRFDMNYTGCEITCILDRASSRMTSLTHKTVTDVSININLDLIVFRTQSVKCTGKITDTVTFTDFVW